MATKTGPISQALATSLQAAALMDADLAGVALCKRYAAMLDAHPELTPDLGPKLLQALTALGLTPAGRGVKGGPGVPAVPSGIDEIRERRARKNRTADSNASGS